MNRNRKQNKYFKQSTKRNVVTNCVGQVEAVGPDWKPLQNPELGGTIVTFTVSYYRDRTDEDEYTTRYSWQWAPMTIKKTYRSVNIPMNKNGVARLWIRSVPESKSSVIIEAKVSLTKRLHVTPHSLDRVVYSQLSNQL